jgi:hypothetical protein
LIQINERAYLKCDSQFDDVVGRGRLHFEKCSERDGIVYYFDAQQQDCVDASRREYRQAGTSGNSFVYIELIYLVFYLFVSGSGRVGDMCSFNTDCLSGMYCTSGYCTCLSTYINVDGYCYSSKVICG